MKRELAVGVMAIFLLLPACSRKPAAAKPDPLLQAYWVVQDTNDPQHLIPLDYQQAQGARVFQANCVWCHADATPAGPSNRSNVTPTPPLLNDGATLNPLNDQFLQRHHHAGWKRHGQIGDDASLGPHLDCGRSSGRDRIHPRDRPTPLPASGAPSRLGFQEVMFMTCRGLRYSTPSRRGLNELHVAFAMNEDSSEISRRVRETIEEET